MIKNTEEDVLLAIELIAAHWLEDASDRHPEHQHEIDALSERFDIATGELSAVDDPGGHFMSRPETRAEIVHVLQEVVAVMRDTLKYFDAPRGH